MPQFPVGQIHFCGVVRNVFYSSLVFPFVPCFQRLGASVSAVGCCCFCRLCQFFFNVTLGAGLGVSSLSKSTRFEQSAISWYRGASHDCKWLRLPEFQSLILRF